jgi:hypothetical protein
MPVGREEDLVLFLHFSDLPLQLLVLLVGGVVLVAVAVVVVGGARRCRSHLGHFALVRLAAEVALQSFGRRDLQKLNRFKICFFYLHRYEIIEIPEDFC